MASNQKEAGFIHQKEKMSDIIPIFAGMEKCAPSHSFGPYIRDYFLIHFIKSGRGVFFNHKTGVSHRLGKSSVFVIKPGELTTYTADPQEPWEYMWIGFYANEYYSEKLTGLPDTADYPYDSFEKIEDSLDFGNTTCELAASVIFEMMHHLFFAEKRDADPAAQVKAYIKQHYMEQITVENIAADIGLDRRYLSRLFKKRYGVAIKEYIIDVRIQKAKEFLTRGFSVSEAAFMSGYSDAFGFSKLFSKREGLSPSQYKTKGLSVV